MSIHEERRISMRDNRVYESAEVFVAVDVELFESLVSLLLRFRSPDALRKFERGLKRLQEYRVG